VCRNDLEVLKELQVDLTTQHRIAADLLTEVRRKFGFTYQCQCVLNTVSVVAATISNLQKLEAVLTGRTEVSTNELNHLHVAVKRYVHCLKSELRPWLSNVLPVIIGGTERTETELMVSLLLLSL